jgi:hypothetical protein
MAATDRKLKIYITPQYTTLECNCYVVIVRVSMKKPLNITKMNNNINMDCPITGSVNGLLTKKIKSVGLKALLGQKNHN